MHNLKIRIRNAIVAVTILVGVGIGTVVVAAPAQAATNGWVTACFKFTPSRGGGVWTGAQTAMTYRGNWPTYSLPQTSRNGGDRVGRPVGGLVLDRRDVSDLAVQAAVVELMWVIGVKSRS